MPVTYSQLEGYYQSIRIRGARSADAVFADMAKFSELDMGPVSASVNVTSVGQIITWDMKQLIPNDLGQGNFDVKVTKYDSEARYIVVRTLAGHPLAGWRYWGVREVGRGDLLIETFAVEHPATIVDSFKLAAGGRDAMRGTWTSMLRDLVRRSGGAEVFSNDSMPRGGKIHNIAAYYQRVAD